MLNEHEIKFRVRYPETDGMGVVHHSRFFQYFEMGRVELLRANGISYAQLEMSGVLFVIVKAECRYKAPARYDDEIDVRTQATLLSRVRIRFDYAVTRGDDVLSSGHTVHAFPPLIQVSIGFP